MTAFEAALAEVEALVAAPPCEAPRLLAALRAVGDARPLRIGGGHLQRVLTLCYKVGGIGGERVALTGEDELDYGARRLDWSVSTLIDRSLYDAHGDHDGFRRASEFRQRALRRPPHEGMPEYQPLLTHAALTDEEGDALLAPFLAHLETRMEDDPWDHLKGAWDMLTQPLPPFDGVARRWLASLDARGIGQGPHLEALDRAMALDWMADEVRQRLPWSAVEQDIWPQVCDPHPLIATHAAKLLGMFTEEAEELIQGPPPPPTPVMLGRLVVEPIHRRAAAGGFLYGIGRWHGEPFGRLAGFPGMAGFDVEGWVLDVLRGSADEVYLPGSQAFWFFLHERYWADPAMAHRLLDEGHRGIAFMCATEGRPPAPGMDGVLERIATLEGETPFGASARAAIGRGGH